MAVSQPVGSIVGGLLVAASCGVILATVGQTAAAEREVLARIDDAGTRSVVIVDTDGSAQIPVDAVERVAALSATEWVIGLGPASDVTNAGIPGGLPSAVRTLYGELPGSPYLTTSPWERRPGTALVGETARLTLGLPTAVGGVIGSRGELAAVGSFVASDPLDFLEAGIIAAPDPDSPETLRSVQILARTPQAVATLADAALDVLGAEQPSSVAVETSEAFALLREAVAGELGRFSRQLVTIVLGVGLILVGLTVYGSVTTRRRDFGRRRALGAGRGTLVGLVLTQTLLVAVCGAILGTGIGTWTAWRTAGTAPQASFIIAVAVLAVLIAVAAGVIPALIAANRDPVRILRVP
ncbi:MAG: FtsX-like permease family protein [Actinobacteria bacterium]|nr:FtsX-like permease family protein [Actinomycetota bacterium]